MKRSLFTPQCKRTFLTISASTLMLGAAHAGTSVGINIAGGSYAYYGVYSSVAYPQYYSGFPVTATAFGVPAANWTSTVTPPVGVVGVSDGSYPFTGASSGSVTAGPGGGVGVSWTTADTWGTQAALDLMATNGANVYVSPPPGNDEVLWGILDNTGWSVSLSGLNAAFPHGYVVACIGAGKVTTTSQIEFTDGASVDLWLPFTTTFTAGSAAYPVKVGLMATPALNSDTLTIDNPSRPSSTNCAMAGFIVTDQPVVAQDPLGVTNVLGASFILSPTVVGLTNNLYYQWQHAGTNIPGANSLTYTNLAAAYADAGSYAVVVTNLYGSVTSAVAQVSILPPTLWVWKGNVNGAWDIATTANWTTNGVAAQYADNSLVQFDDTATTTLVSNAVTVSPFSLSVTNNTKSYTIVGSPIAGSTGLIKSGTNALTLAGTNNTFTGNILINAGSLTIGGAGQLAGGTYFPAITNNGSFIFASSANQTFSGAISGSGSYTMNGTGTNTLTVDQPLTGGIVVNSGILRVTAGNFDAQFTPSLVTVNPGGTLLGDNTHALGYSTSLFLNGGVWLMNYEDYKLNLTMVDGEIDAGPGGNGGEFRLGYFGTSVVVVSNSVVGSVINEKVSCVGSANNVINVVRGAAASDLTINGLISNTGGLTKTGNGILTLANSANSYTGPTTINGGKLILSGGLTASAVTVATNGNLILVGAGNIGGSATVTVQAGGSLALDPAGMNTNSVGSLTLSGNITFRISKTGGTLANDQINGLSSVTYGGKLTVTNLTSDSTPLALGDAFQLFPVGITYAGGFSSFQLPALPFGLSWDVSQFAVNGTLVVTNVTFAPVFSLAAGSYYGAQNVTISSLTAGAVIYYTTNGTTPTPSSPHAASPVVIHLPINTVMTINAYAAASGYSSSSVQTAAYNTTTPPYIASVMGTGPIAYWPLNESNGPVAFDVVNGYNGTYGSSISYGTTGPAITSDTGITCDGTLTGVMLTPYSAALNPATFTVTAWVNPAVDLTGATLTAALSCGQFASSGRSGWLIYQSATGWNLRTYINSGTTAAVNVTGATVPASGNWYHLAATWDGTTAKLYVNGVLDASQAPTTTPKYVAGQSGGFAVGMRADNAFPWAGSTADVALYNHVLNAAQIAALATNGVVPMVNTTPTNIVSTISGNTLTLTWPADHLGWKLQAQTNALNAGLTTNWITVPGSDTITSKTITIDPTKPTVFYRLTYP